MEIKMANKLQTDPQLKNLVEEYLAVYRSSYGATYKDAGIDLSEDGFKVTQFGYIRLDQPLYKAQHKVVQRCCSLLGPNKAHEGSIARIIDSAAQVMLQNSQSIEDARKAIIADILAATNTKYRIMLPNHLIKFTEPVDEITIGPVTALLTSKAQNEIRDLDHINIKTGPDWKFHFGENGVEIALPPVCWLVDIETDKGNVHIEAAWLVDVAVSLLRLYTTERSPLMSRPGNVEAAPTWKMSGDQVGIKLWQGGQSAGATSMLGYYVITQALADNVASPEFQTQANSIFFPKHNSLAERVNQALGWMTRGRRSFDPSERLLFFFTAIEALLSTSDKSAPVVQTIARHAAVLLTDDNKDRVQIAATIRALYELRSKVVHAGARAARISQAQQTEIIAENLLATTIHIADLSTTHSEFCGGLSEASYGLAWKLAEAVEDSPTLPPPSPAT